MNPLSADDLIKSLTESDILPKRANVNLARKIITEHLKSIYDQGVLDERINRNQKAYNEYLNNLKKQ